MKGENKRIPDENMKNFLLRMQGIERKKELKKIVLAKRGKNGMPTTQQMQFAHTKI